MSDGQYDFLINVDGANAAASMANFQKQAKGLNEPIEKIRGVMNAAGVASSSLAGGVGQAGASLLGVFGAGGPVAVGVAAVTTGIGLLATHYQKAGEAARAAAEKATRAREAENQKIDATIERLNDEIRLIGIKSRGQSADQNAALREIERTRQDVGRAEAALATERAKYGRGLFNDVEDLEAKLAEARKAAIQAQKLLDTATAADDARAAAEAEATITSIKRGALDERGQIEAEFKDREKQANELRANGQDAIATDLELTALDEKFRKVAELDAKRAKEAKASGKELAATARENERSVFDAKTEAMKAASDKILALEKAQTDNRNDFIRRAVEEGDRLEEEKAKSRVETAKATSEALAALWERDFEIAKAAAEKNAEIVRGALEGVQSMAQGAISGAIGEGISELLDQSDYAEEAAQRQMENRILRSEIDSRLAAKQKKENEAAIRERREATKVYLTEDEKRAAAMDAEREALSAQGKYATAAVNEKLAAVLEGIAVEAGTRAIFEGAMALASLATLNYPAAAAHGTAAGIFAGLAISAGGISAGISSTRGQTQSEADAASSANEDRESLLADEELRADREDRRQSAASRAVAGGAGGVVVNLNIVGAPLLTEAELGARIKQAQEAFEAQQ